MEASKNGYYKVVEPLLFHSDIQVNKATWDDGTTALIYACKNNHKAVAELLLRCPETDVSHQNSNFRNSEPR